MTTNMEQIRSAAKSLLYLDLDFDEKYGFIVHHPFFSHHVYAVRDMGGMKLLNLSDTKDLDTARSAIEVSIDKTRDVFSFFTLINKPYLPAFFKFAHSAMSAEDYARFLAEMWVLVEFPNYDRNISTHEFVKLFRNANKQLLMGEEEMEYYLRLPNTITVYRGLQRGATVNGLSWTTSLNTAQWFAERWSASGEVYSAQINKQDVLAYFSTRGESEIVVDFKKLKNVCKYN